MASQNLTNTNTFKDMKLDQLKNLLKSLNTNLINGIGSTKMTGDSEESWFQETLGAAIDTPAIDGADFDFVDYEAKGQLTNYPQITMKGVKVTGSSQASKEYGIENAIMHEVYNTQKRMLNGLEKNVAGYQKATKGDSATIANAFGGLGSVLNDNIVAAGTDEVEGTSDFATTRVAATSLVSIAKSDIASVQKQCYDKGGKPTKLFMASDLYAAAAGFTGQETRNIDAKEKTVVDAVQVVWGQFGPTFLELVHNMRNDVAYLLQPEYVKVAYKRPMATRDLPSSGDYVAKGLLMEATLVVTATDSSGSIFDRQA